MTFSTAIIGVLFAVFACCCSSSVLGLFGVSQGWFDQFFPATTGTSTGTATTGTVTRTSTGTQSGTGTPDPTKVQKTYGNNGSVTCQKFCNGEWGKGQLASKFATFPEYIGAMKASSQSQATTDTTCDCIMSKTDAWGTKLDV